MNTRKRVGEIAVFLLVAGAGTQPAGSREPNEAELQQEVADYNAEAKTPSMEVVCKHEARVGSRIKTPVCRTKGFMANERAELERIMNRPRPTVTTDDPLHF
jgi:hypothetical protein